MNTFFSLTRLIVIVRKEMVLMWRDPASIMIMLILPISMIILFGYTVKANPHKIPTALVNQDDNVLTRRFISALENSDYFLINYRGVSSDRATELLEKNKVQFIITVPPHFSHQLLKHQQPKILVEIDSILPIGISLPLENLQHAASYALDEEFKGSLSFLQTQKPTIQVIRHYVYNPHLSSPVSIIPNTIGLVLMLSMLMLTNVTAFRDRNEGTFDSLIVSPLSACEIILGGVLAYIMIGYLQLTAALILAYWLFDVPILGHILIIYALVLPYLVAELSLGMLIAVLCETQLQAVQISNLCIAISMVLSGFLFPYWGIPSAMRWLSESIPLTHFLRILHGTMLKGSPVSYLFADLFALIVFCVVTIGLAIFFYRYRAQE